MQEAVKYQINYSKDNPIRKGDVILTNHPGIKFFFIIVFYFFN
jgi:N-methylhydantoinase B/oxoprolinase/acetone carboxylase alpha subunit